MTSADIKPSSTILLLRDDPDANTAPLEVMMVKRNYQIDFASGALVFPGGKVSPFDEQVPKSLVQNDGGFSDEMIPYAIAAIRECFEESGVLLALDAKTGALVSKSRVEEAYPYRPQLDKDEIGMAAFLEKEGFLLDLSFLVHFSHWITPEMVPKRFTTHFFLAKAPAEQIARHDGREAVETLWIKPAQALQEEKQGLRTIIFPTKCNIEKLGLSATTDDALQKAANEEVHSILPWMEPSDEGPVLCIDENAGYPTTKELFSPPVK